MVFAGSRINTCSRSKQKRQKTEQANYSLKAFNFKSFVTLREIGAKA